jgi:hypothetical protein
MKIVIGDRRIFGVRGRAQRDTAWIDLKRRRRFALPAHSKIVSFPSGRNILSSLSTQRRIMTQPNPSD